MASSSKKVSLKLQIDSKNNKVLFAEAGKDFIDFLFTLLSLPVGTVTRLLTVKSMVGCIGNLYGSVENLSETYMQPNLHKEVLLKPKAMCSTEASLFLADDVKALNKVYQCQKCNWYVCTSTISREVKFAVAAKDGYVKGAVPYMVMDDLAVTPLSTSSVTSLLSKNNVTNVGDLLEKVVTFGMDEGLELLMGSLHSKTILTSIFLGEKDAKNRGRSLSDIHSGLDLSYGIFRN